jgi:RNA recognition motif-containing protein
MKLYVGNLSYQTNQDTLYDAFGAHGKVDEVAVVMDRETGRPRGFAFVSMNNDQEARAAIEALNGADVDGRTITVNEARPKENNRGGGGGYGGGGRSRGGYGGGGGGRGGGGGDRW